MLPRSQLIAALVAIEIAIVIGMVVAIRGDHNNPWMAEAQAPGTAAAAYSGPHLIEGGPHQVMTTGPRPTLTVDIGYADLTIITRDGSEMDLSVSKSNAFGYFRARQPIVAHQVGDSVRISKGAESGMTIGDDRMVTAVVPPGTLLTVVEAGDITVTGLRAEASIRSVGNGSVTVQDFDGPSLRVASSNGHITLHGVTTPQLNATDHNGSIEGTALRVRNGNVETSNDDVTLEFAPGSNAVVSAGTSNGNVHVSGLEAVPGSVRKGDDDDDDAVAQSVRLGNGEGRLDVHSSNGDVTLTQQT